MTVKELIIELLTCDMDSDVIIELNDNKYVGIAYLNDGDGPIAFKTLITPDDNLTLGEREIVTFSGNPSNPIPVYKDEL